VQTRKARRLDGMPSTTPRVLPWRPGPPNQTQSAFQGCLRWIWGTRLKNATFSQCMSIALANEASWFIHASGSLCDWGSRIPDRIEPVARPSDCTNQGLVPLHMLALDDSNGECDGNSCISLTVLVVLLCAVGSLSLVAAAGMWTTIRIASRSPVEPGTALEPVVAQPVTEAHAVHVASEASCVPSFVPSASSSSGTEAGLMLLQRLRERRLITASEFSEKRETILATLAVPVCGRSHESVTYVQPASDVGSHPPPPLGSCGA